MADEIEILEPGKLYQNEVYSRRFPIGVDFIVLDSVREITPALAKQLAFKFGVFPSARDRRALYIVANIDGHEIDLPGKDFPGESNSVGVEHLVEMFSLEEFARYESVVIVADESAKATKNSVAEVVPSFCYALTEFLVSKGARDTTVYGTEDLVHFNQNVTKQRGLRSFTATPGESGITAGRFIKPSSPGTAAARDTTWMANPVNLKPGSR